MLLQHGGLANERAEALIEAVLALPDGGVLPDFAELMS
jgi:hypothetical protein